MTSEQSAETWEQELSNVLHALMPEATPRQRLITAQWLNNNYAGILADHAAAQRENENWSDVWESAHNSFAMLFNECNRVANALNLEGAFEWTEGLQPIIDQIATERARADKAEAELNAINQPPRSNWTKDQWRQLAELARHRAEVAEATVAALLRLASS